MRLTPDPATRRPDPEPLQTDLLRIVLVGVAIWAALFVVALLARTWLEHHDRTWMLWVPPCGIALGLIGLPWARRNSD